MGTVANILTGAASVYMMPYGSGSNNPVSSNAVSWSSFTQLGFKTSDGVQIEYTPEFLNIVVEEHNAAVKHVLTGEECKITLTLQESNLAQLIYAFTGGTYTAGATPGTNENSFTIGDGSVTEYSFGLEGIASTGNELVVFAPKVVATGTVGTPYAKGQVRVVPIELTCVADPTETDGETLLQMYEITSGA